MQISVTGHHITVSEPLREYVESKLEKINKHFNNITNVHVILTVEKLEQKAQAHVHLDGSEIHAEAIEEYIYASIDSLIDKLDRQVIKYKEKLNKHSDDKI